MYDAYKITPAMTHIFILPGKTHCW